MSNLPPDWKQVPLAAITSEANQRIPSADEQITYIDIGSVDRNSKVIVAPQHLSGADAPSLARKQVRHGDTLVSMTRPNLNAVALVPPELDGQIASTGFDVLRPLEGIDPRWIAYLVRTEAFVETMSSAVQGALYPAVRSKDIRAYLVPLASTVEQTRIADQLDKLLARIQACNDRIDAIPALLKRFRQAVLTAATSGALTEDWRAQREAGVARMEPSAESGNRVRDSGQLSYQVTPTPDSASLHPGYGATDEESRSAVGLYPRVPLGSLIADGPHNGLYKHSSVYGAGTGILRIDMFYDGEVTAWNAMKRLAVSPSETETYGLSVGDIIVNRVNSPPYVGKAALIRALPEPCVFESNMMRLRLVCGRILPEYCIRFLSSPDGLSRLRRNVKHAVNQASINQTDVKAVEVPLPSMEEQAEIVRRVEALFKLADRIESRYKAARTQAQRLTPLLLAKAFRGELVPQDPNDEPASALLERIRAQDGEPVPRAARRGRKANTV